ncbi:MAG TPA: dipeptide/oligopeptide/nickel ABC transporter ATP-binding protein [Terriglobales bacterium]|nr:dipeptide/oligopeptide/nickel ABC transporter ATP-binding protein [Terriglobales bacterium]
MPSLTLNPMLRVEGLTKRYVRGGLWRNRSEVAAVDGVDFEIHEGRTLALVGESGSGKSSVARCVAYLERPDRGSIWIDGRDVTARRSKQRSRVGLFLRNRVQMVFQDAVTSMNPRLTALEVVEEPLLIMGLDRSLRKQAAEKVVREVGLPPEWLARRVLEFSGGQRQRLAIARSLVTRPRLLVLDEALTGLDLSTQAQIANLLLDLQAAHRLTYLLISHDLALVARLADTIAVMAHGKIVESGPAFETMTSPEHEETKRLVECARAAQANFAAVSGTGS